MDSPPPEDAVCYTVGWGENNGPRRRVSYWDYNPFWPFGNTRRERLQRRPDSLKQIEVNIESLDRCFRDDEEESDVQICAGNPEKVNVLEWLNCLLYDSIYFLILIF